MKCQLFIASELQPVNVQGAEWVLVLLVVLESRESAAVREMFRMRFSMMPPKV